MCAVVRKERPPPFQLGPVSSSLDLDLLLVLVFVFLFVFVFFFFFPLPHVFIQPPSMNDEDAYKEYMRKKLEYQDWENSILREAMKRIAAQGGA